MFTRAAGFGALLFLLIVGVVSAAATAAPSLTVLPASGPPGASVAVSGAGFPSHTAVTFRWDGLATPGPTVSTRGNGAFSASLVVPQLLAGNHTLSAVAGGVSASVIVGIAGPAPNPTGTPTIASSPTPTPTQTSTSVPTSTLTSTAAPTSTPVASPTPTPWLSSPAIGGCPVLPADDIWNTRIDTLP